MAFSGALKLTDLNDFITPSQACIKPVTTSEPQPDAAAPATQIQIGSDGQYYEIGTSSDGQKLEKAQVNLSDCLACSGCITSAETVLITAQSHTEVLNALENNTSNKIPVISISPQSLASLAIAVSSRTKTVVTSRQILRRTRTFCKQVLGFQYVFDTTFARHLALNEHTKEFCERRRGAGRLPMLASACPGWICYAEKTRPEILEFISKTKSPQQVMGSLVKNWMGAQWNRLPDEIYHVTVMPCYDKKLEASRNDFYNEIYATRDVDFVITTGELEILMSEKGFDLSRSVPSELDQQLADLGTLEGRLPELMKHPGTSSGSYLQAIIDHIISESPEPLDLELKQIRHEDYEEFTLRRKPTDQSTPGEIVFLGAKCYGFRNLQNLVRKVGTQSGIRVGSGAAGRLSERRKTTASSSKRGYDYVEVMSCPGGCVNGGGQIKPPALGVEGYPSTEESPEILSRWANKEWTKKIEEAYWQGERPSGEVDVADRLMASVLDDLCLTDEGWGDVDVCEERDLCRKRFFRTQYQAVESDVVGFGVKW